MSHPGPAVVAISGMIGSGKTTIATLLSERLRWPYAAYGDLIRTVAASRGLTGDRADLQQIGGELIAAGWDSFTRLVLGQASWAPGQALILDGLRHAAGAGALARIVAPLPAIVIYLDVPAATGLARARDRDHLPRHRGRRDDLHPVELDLPAVRDQADLVVPASEDTPSQVATQIISHLRQLGERRG